MSTEKQTIMQHKPFWDNGHFFRDISLILIFIQIYSEYQDVVAGFATMDYTMVILSMAIGEIPPFVFQMGWCFILLLMFIFTLGGTSRWPLTIQIFITMGMMVKYYLVLDYAWLVFLGFSFIVYCAAVREVRRREVRQYLSDILPGEGQTPLWQLLLAVIILNAAFTFPAYQKYTNKMQELNAEYQKDIEGFTQMKKVVENINQTASNISQGVIDSETYKMLQYYANQMFANNGGQPPKPYQNMPSVTPPKTMQNDDWLNPPMPQETKKTIVVPKGGYYDME